MHVVARHENQRLAAPAPQKQPARPRRAIRRNHEPRPGAIARPQSSLITHCTTTLAPSPTGTHDTIAHRHTPPSFTKTEHPSMPVSDSTQPLHASSSSIREDSLSAECAHENPTTPPSPETRTDLAPPSAKSSSSNHEGTASIPVCSPASDTAASPSPEPEPPSSANSPGLPHLQPRARGPSSSPHPQLRAHRRSPPQARRRPRSKARRQAPDAPAPSEQHPRLVDIHHQLRRMLQLRKRYAENGGLQTHAEKRRSEAESRSETLLPERLACHRNACL